MLKFFKMLQDYINGDFAYKNYVAHAAKHLEKSAILDKKSFLRERRKLKWNQINRCC